MWVRGNWVFDTSLRNVLIVVMRTIRKIVDAVLQKMLNFPVFLFVVSSQSIKVFWQLADFDTKLTVFFHNNGLIFDHGFKFCLKMPHFDEKLFFYDRFFNVNWILNWNFNRNFNNSLNLNRSINVNRFVNVNWRFYYFCGRNLNSLHNLFDNFHRNFLLNFDVLRNLDHFFNHPFRSWHWFRHFYNHFHWFFNNHFLDDLFWNSWSQTTNLVLSVLQ